MERKPTVGVSATLFAEHERWKAVCAPPLKRSRHAALAHCCLRDTFRLEEAIQVGANPRNKLFHIGMLGLRATSNDTKKGHQGELTLVCSGTSSSIQDGSSTSMGCGSASCDTARSLTISILTVSIPVICRVVEVPISTGKYIVPRERSRAFQSTTLALCFLSDNLDVLMPLGAIGN